MMFARAKYVAGRWPKRVGAHAQMGLPRLKLAQAMTRVMTTFLSARSQRLCCLDHCPRPGIRTLPNSKSRWGGGDSSVVRAPDSWLKGRGFESLLERRENFLLQGRLSVLTLISVSVPPRRVTTVARKKSRHSAKSAGGRLQLNTHTPYVCGFYWTVLRHWSQLVPNMSNDIWGH